ncbi:hypothetical protein [Klebsiella pneumoniae]|uniref:hypothetical protein n=1 Tax=Klebsiella pneumoniae TaxID=573 RepID=UPI001C04FC0D|nr:hypothetical protein [Klebsiella pneumoniae]MBU0210628.1 hypothetical protein [Klebsiella pneumoniae]
MAISFYPGSTIKLECNHEPVYLAVYLSNMSPCPFLFDVSAIGLQSKKQDHFHEVTEKDPKGTIGIDVPFIPTGKGMYI